MNIKFTFRDRNVRNLFRNYFYEWRQFYERIQRYQFALIYNAPFWDFLVYGYRDKLIERSVDFFSWHYFETLNCKA